METRMIHDLTVLTPGLDPRDLDAIEDRPDDDVREASVGRLSWPHLALAGVRIVQSHFMCTELTEADWRGVTLFGCRFEGVDLSGARLTSAVIERCEFMGCRMTGLQLSDSTLKNVIFEDCRLDHASLAASGHSGRSE